MSKRMEEWARKIAEAEACGMTIRQWCKENEISKGTYYYWHKRARVEGLLPGQTNRIDVEDALGRGTPDPEFVELPLPEASSLCTKPPAGYSFDSRIMIQCGQCQVFVGDDFSSQTLARVMEVVR